MRSPGSPPCSMLPSRRAELAAWVLALCAACLAVEPRADVAPPSGRAPYVLVLGTAQDGGLPHVLCEAEACRAARADPAHARRVTSLMLCDPRSGSRWLFDCTPDVEAQLARAAGHPPQRRPSEPRPPPCEGLFLTHAHMGHYAGLLQFGTEAAAVKGLNVWATPRLAGFLSGNDPYRRMVDEGRLCLRELVPGSPVELAPGLSVAPFLVPHRDEFSDTVGFLIRGPRRALAYLPDIDKWERWDEWSDPTSPWPAGARVEALIEACDVALLDGCFFDAGELPGRSMADVSHPCVRESLERFSRLRPALRARVHFTHLNHTNPAARRGSAARAEVERAGHRVLDEGQRFEL